MKKRFFVLMLSFLVLTACGSLGQTTKTEDSSQIATTASESKNTEPITETYAYPQTVKGMSQNIQETISYQGTDYQSLALHIDQALDEGTKKKLEGKDFATIKAQLLSTMGEQGFIKSLKSTRGVKVSVDVTQDYHFIFDVKVDMKLADLEALSAIEGLGVDFNTLKKMKPVDYIAKLKAKGATLVTP